LCLNPNGGIVVAGNKSGGINSKSIVIHYDPSGTILFSKEGDFHSHTLVDCDKNGIVYCIAQNNLGGNSTLSFIAKYTQGASGITLTSQSLSTQPYETIGALNVSHDLSIYLMYEKINSISGQTIRSLTIKKYNQLFNSLWQKTVTGPDLMPGGLCTDKENNIIIGGKFTNSVSIGGTTLTDTHSKLFLASFDPSGSLNWTDKTTGQHAGAAMLDLITDDNSMLYYTGALSHEQTFGSISLSGNDYSDVLITKYKYNSNPVGIADNKGSETCFKIYPNPCMGNFKLNGIAKGTEIKLKILNTLGQLKEEHVWQSIPEQNFRYSLILDNTEKGIYLIELNTGTNREIHKVVIE
jgi:hypothetical protein